MDIKRKAIDCRADNKIGLQGDSVAGSPIEISTIKTSLGEPNKLRVILGILLIVISYILGWPAVSAMAALSLYLDKPSIVTYGGPLIYGFSYVLLFIGLYLAGKKHAHLFYDRLKSLAGRLLMVG